MGKSFFLGNGINRLTDNSSSWESVLRSLAESVNELNLISPPFNEKPFTLVFEEIFLRSARASGVTEINLKNRAAKLIKEIPGNVFHSKFINSGVNHIITTNYDYNFEKSESEKIMKANVQPETKYSLYRRRIQNSVNIWHIHGESSVANSLMLGHEHYSGALQKMRSYLTRKKIISPFMLGDNLFDENGKDYSWVDVFLRDNIHIIGFSLDYTEIDIWWLLSYKERLNLQNKTVGETYFYHFYDKDLENKELAKLDLLESFGVTVIKKMVKDKNSYDEEYQNLL